MQEQHFERLSALSRTAPEGDGTYRVAGVAIGEGDVTQGLSGTETRWPADVLRDAADRLGEAKILKGRAGQGHKPMDEQADPEEIVGRASFDYEPGVGLTYSGELLDEGLARRVDLGVLDVSPDMYRRLGEQNADGVKEAEEIIDVPYLTLLDRGAGPNASVELAEGSAEQAAERLAELLETETETPSDGDGDGTGSEQLQAEGDAVRWDSDAGGDREPSDVRYGVVADELQDGPDGEVLVAVYQPTSEYDGWEARNEQNQMSEERLEVVGSNGKESLPAVSSVVDSEQAGDGSTPGSPTADGSSGNDPADTGSTSTPMTENDNLQEQLSSVRSERDELEDTVEQLEDQLDDKTDEIEELEERLAPLRELLAEIATEGSALDAETVAESHTVPELVGQLGDDVDGDDDVDYTDAIKEQLEGTVAPRGEGTDDGDGNGGSEQLSAEEREQAEQLAQSVMTLDDMRDMDRAGLDAREYLAREYDVDPAQYNHEEPLREAVNRAGGD